ncbi:MAG TPA: TPM domain-containing protein [Caulobacteraceae bacterium]|nr:TPM domain-containing protein [Caulobacteraceae bacterium]
MKSLRWAAPEGLAVNKTAKPPSNLSSERVWRARPLHTFAQLALAVVVAFTALASPTLADPKFPPLTGRVVDQANVLSAATEADLTNKLAGLEQSTGRQLVVVTIPSLQGYEIEDYGYQLGRAWGIGSKANNDGVLFLVAPSEHKVRIEVGYGLEGVLTDALSSSILQQAVLPKFRSGDIEDGVVQGTDAIVQQLSLPDDEAKAKAAQATAAPKKSHGGIPPFAILIILFVVFSMLSGLGRRRRFGGSGLGSVLPWIILGSLNNRRGGWGGGDWGGGGGGFGGGGFSGGGGSFGGGGSSGSW